MKNYINYMFRRYRLRLSAAGAALLIIMALISSVFFMISKQGLYSTKVNMLEEITVETENSDEYAANSYTSPLDEFSSDINNIGSGSEKRVQEMIKNNEKITKKDAEDIYKAYKKMNGTDFSIYKFSLKDKWNGERGEYVIYDEPDSNLIDGRYPLFAAFASKAPVTSVIPMSMLIIFVFIVSGTVTSADSMLRVKLFEESAPISKRKKYLSKILFTSAFAAVFALAEILILFLIYRFSAISEAVNYSELLYGLLYMIITGISASAVLIFLGNMCGNIFSYAASAILAFGGMSLLFIILFLLYPGYALESIMGEVYYEGLSYIDSTYWLNPYRLILISMSFKIVLQTLLGSAAVGAAGYFLSEHMENERRGMFYMNRYMSRVYWLIALFISAGVFSRAFGAFGVFIELIVLVLSAVLFGWILNRLFKVRIRV